VRARLVTDVEGDVSMDIDVVEQPICSHTLLLAGLLFSAFPSFTLYSLISIKMQVPLASFIGCMAIVKAECSVASNLR